MKLFVTGTESFVGRALGARCRADSIEFSGIDSADSATQKADIRDPAIADLIPEGAVVVHLAAISRDGDCRANPQIAYDINVNGTVNVAQAALKRKAPQVIFASSEWVYGDVRNDEVQTEASPIDVTSMKSEYALTKIVGEQWLRLMGALPAATVLRFGIIYGTRGSNWSAVESLFNTVRTKDEVTIGAAATARRFIHVDDIVSGMLASVGRNGFEIFNLSGDRPITLGEVVGTSAKILGREIPIKESNPAQPSVRNPDNMKARTALNWQPLISLEQGLTSLGNFLAREHADAARS